jgi:pyridoxamine 5'-phosphate oxidase
LWWGDSLGCTKKLNPVRINEMMQTNPIIELSLWLDNERDEGAPNPNHAVLSSISLDGFPHSRVVAIREIQDEGLLFFTQIGTRKVTELHHNHHVSLVFWLELLQREVIIEGKAFPLSEKEHQDYWEIYPKWAQIRFLKQLRELGHLEHLIWAK